jgi:dihydrofolate reductase
MIFARRIGRSGKHNSSPARSIQRRRPIMGNIAVHEFITLDGVVEDPRWTMEFPFDPKMGEAIGALTQTSEGILLGRRTYEMFAPAWSGRTAEDDPGAPFFNETHKYIVSSTLQSADWNNSEVIGGYSAGTIRALKDRSDGNLYVSGSVSLVRAMMADGLVDELHLFLYPVALGAGLRLFAEGGAPVRLALAECESYESGVVHLCYRPAT